jgi:hypothetical protein
MRWPFFDPPQDEIAAVACDLIVRFGLQSHDEALYLAEVAANMGARKNLQLYRLAAREIEKSFAEARLRLNARAGSNVLRKSALVARGFVEDRERDAPNAIAPRRRSAHH